MKMVPGSLSRRGPAWFAKGSSAELSFISTAVEALELSARMVVPAGLEPALHRLLRRTVGARVLRVSRSGTVQLTVQSPAFPSWGRGEGETPIGQSPRSPMRHSSRRPLHLPSYPVPAPFRPGLLLRTALNRFASGSTPRGLAAGGCLPFCITGRKSNPFSSRSRRDPRARPAP